MSAGTRAAARGRVVIALVIALAAGCQPAAAPPSPSRKGCRLDLASHVATCPCALPADVSEIPDRADLETLRVHFSGETSPRGLARLTHLRALELVMSSAAQLEAIGTLSRLEELTVVSETAPDLAPLARLPRLRKLTLRLLDRAEAIDLRPLGASAALRELRIEGPRASLEGIAGLASLEVLSLAWPADADAGDVGGEQAERERPTTLTVRHDAAPPAVPKLEGGICELDPTACPSARDLYAFQFSCRP